MSRWPGCTCDTDPGNDGPSPECPVHGDYAEAHKSARQERIEALAQINNTAAEVAAAQRLPDGYEMVWEPDKGVKMVDIEPE
jgi:hypothetical protein